MTQTETVAPPEPVDWQLAERVARRFAGRDPIADSYLGGSLHSDFSTVTTRAEALVADYTGLHAPGTASACVLDRPQWVHANVGSMRRMLHPLTTRVGERMARSPVAPIGRRVAGTEMGVLLGFMAQRVLGQYDLLVPDDPDDMVITAGPMVAAATAALPTGAAGAGACDGDQQGSGGAVYYVGANILALEKRYAFRPRDFRLWIAIHEVTHRAQFTAIPWMKQYFLSLVEQALTIVDPDPGRLVQAMMRAADELRQGRNPLDDGGLVALFASQQQRGVLAQVQALMSLLEGHGNSVMNALGKAHVAGQERMARVLQARRRSRGVAGVLYKLLGFESKLRQYEVGETFVAEVERAGGPRAIDAAWRGPDYLPSIDELAQPNRWLSRVA